MAGAHRGDGSSGSDNGRAVWRVVRIVFLPWLTATYLFKPRVGPRGRDRTLDRLAFWRSVFGLLVVVVATSAWRPPGDVVDSVQTKMITTMMFAMYALPLLVLVMIVATRSGYRRALLRGVPRLLGRLALASIAPASLVATFLVLGTDGLIPESVELRGLEEVGLALLLFVGILVGSFWLVHFIGATYYWAARTGVWLSEGTTSVSNRANS